MVALISPDLGQITHGFVYAKNLLNKHNSRCRFFGGLTKIGCKCFAIMAVHLDVGRHKTPPENKFMIDYDLFLIIHESALPAQERARRQVYSEPPFGWVRLPRVAMAGPKTLTTPVIALRSLHTQCAPALPRREQLNTWDSVRPTYRR